MEDLSYISSEEELLELRNEGKISEDEYNQLRRAMQKSSSDETSLPDRLSPTARLSRCAVWGAAWAPFFFFLLVCLMPHRTVHYEGQPPYGPAWWQYLLRFTVLPVGLSAPFGTTILGLISISQVRHSVGKLYGLGLAVADVLFFPLLALLGAIYWFVGLINKICLEGRIYGPGFFLNQKETALVIALVIWALLAWLFSRWVWRAANKPLKGSLK